MNRKRKMLYRAPLIFAGVLVFIAIGGAIVMLLWNWLLPPLFGFHELTFWRAIGILALSRILFGGLGMRGGPRGWRRRAAENWASMTPEERERFREAMLKRWGSFSEPGGGESGAH